jgi:hypothetical protein
MHPNFQFGKMLKKVHLKFKVMAYIDVLDQYL